MDLASCIALIVFGLIVFFGRLFLAKTDYFPKFDVLHPTKHGLGAMCLNLFVIAMALGTFIAGIVNLIILLL